MSEDKEMSIEDKFSMLIILLILIAIAGAILNVMFGDCLKATASMNIDTATTQNKLIDALYENFNESGGRLELNLDYSVHAYISKSNYMQIPYPDRDEHIRNLGRIWCNGNKIPHYFLPKVFINDIHTGEKLGSCGCVTGWVSKE